MICKMTEILYIQTFHTMYVCTLAISYTHNFRLLLMINWKLRKSTLINGTNHKNRSSPTREEIITSPQKPSCETPDEPPQDVKLGRKIFSL